jgi:hypothetical protein
MNLKRWFSMKSALAIFALFVCFYIAYHYYFASQYDRLALAKPEQLETVRMVRYFSPPWYGLFQPDSEIAQLENGERLVIAPMPMGIFTGRLVLALPIPSAYETSYQAISRSEQPDGSLRPLDPDHPPPLDLQINRHTGHVCYKSDCAQLRSICPPFILLGNPKGPHCKHFRH